MLTIGCHLSSSKGFAAMGRQASELGAKSIVIDPIYTNLACKADRWLPVTPATDAALAMGLMNVIVTEDLYDHEFVEKWSNLPGLVRDDTGAMLTEFDLTGEYPNRYKGCPRRCCRPSAS